MQTQSAQVSTETTPQHKQPSGGLPASAAPLVNSLEQDAEGKWQCGSVPQVTPALQQAAREAEQAVQQRLAPADREWLAGAVQTLLDHFYSANFPDWEYEAIARDWLDVLGDFPHWAIERARIEYLKTSGKKPAPAAIRKLCEDQVSKEMALKRLCKRVLNTTPVQDNQYAPDPKANDDTDGPEKVRVIRQGLKMGKSPDQALQDAGYAVAGTGSGHDGLADLFERFWQAYPKQVAKPKAWEAFREAVAAGCDPETLIAAANIADEVASEQQIDRQYTPNPAKFLKERRWEDGEIKARLQGGAMEQATPHQEPVEA